MSLQPGHRHYVRRVVLPSGKTIEVVYFEDRRSAHTELPASRDDLHHCETCGANLVYPLEWVEAGATHWQVTLRCPNCEWSGTSVFEQAAVEAFDEQLDRGTELLVGDLKRLMRANMQDEIDRFIVALEDDHILPDDF